MVGWLVSQQEHPTIDYLEKNKLRRSFPWTWNHQNQLQLLKNGTFLCFPGIFSSKRQRSSKQIARNQSCNFQTSTKIIHITYCHMIDRLGLFYSFCCCFFVRFQSPCSSVREFLEILRISTTDQKNPLEFDQHRFCFFAKTAIFFSRDFFYHPNVPTRLESRQLLFRKVFWTIFFLASWFSPITFSASALPMFWVFSSKHHKKTSPKLEQ